LWIKNLCDLLNRLKNDLESIEKLFNKKNTPLGKIAEIECSLSDPHEGGRSVCILHFQNLTKLVYKPKNINVDKAYYDFLNYYNQSNPDTKFRIIQMICRNEYGWVEYVENQEILEEESLEKYYTYAGKQLAIFYLLGGHDGHTDNIITDGEQAVFIDLETIMQPLDLDLEHEKEALSMAFDGNHSVIQTGLLPIWNHTSNEQLINFGGFSNLEESIPQYVWTSINTDLMQRQVQTVQGKTPAAVTFKGNLVNPAQYLDFILKGFEKAYTFIESEKEFLLSENSLLHKFLGQKNRIVPRNTSVYYKIHTHTNKARFLSCRIKRRAELERLLCPISLKESKSTLLQFTQKEIEDLDNLDIPFFQGQTDSKKSLSLSENSPDVFKVTGYDQCIKRIKNTNPIEMKKQINMINGAFHTLTIDPIIDEENELAFSSIKIDSSMNSSLDSEINKKILEIAQETTLHFFTNDKNAMNCYGLQLEPKGKFFTYEILDFDLYQGVFGPLLFLSALDSVQRKSDYSSLVEKTLHPLSKSLHEESSNIWQSYTLERGLGIGGGLGSVIYFFTTLAKLSQHNHFLDLAIKASKYITPETLKKDEEFDLIFGTAGSLLALISLYKMRKEASLLPTIQACVQYLETYKWKKIGFSHGAAGIAYALFKAYAILGKKSILHKAKEGLIFEDKHFSFENNNWKFNHDSRILPTNWCRGAAGIALSRVAIIDIYTSESTKRDIESALETVKASGISQCDHICCGNFGSIEFLLKASEMQGNTYLKTEIHHRISTLLHHRKETGFQYPSLKNKKFFYPGFFKGSSGVAYQLLRFMYPESLPSVLLFE
jgi:type 2 lantibiotic biosynthesis protein LanM